MGREFVVVEVHVGEVEDPTTGVVTRYEAGSAAELEEMMAGDEELDEQLVWQVEDA